MAFFAIRVILFVLWFAVMIWSMVDWVNDEDINGNNYNYGYWWTQLTHISLIVQLIYLGFAAATTGLALFSSLPDGTGTKGTPWFVSVTWAMQPMMLIVTLIVFLLYWALLFEPRDTVYAISVFTHGVNFGIMLFDLTLSRQPLYLVHVYMPLVFAACFLLFSLIYYAADGRNHENPDDRFIYDVLDWSDPAAVGSLGAVILLIGVPVLWILIYCLGLFYRCQQIKTGKIFEPSENGYPAPAEV